MAATNEGAATQKTDRATQGAATQKPTYERRNSLSNLGARGGGPKNPGVVAPLTFYKLSRQLQAFVGRARLEHLPCFVCHRGLLRCRAARDAITTPAQGHSISHLVGFVEYLQVCDFLLSQVPSSASWPRPHCLAARAGCASERACVCEYGKDCAFALRGHGARML